MSDTQGWVTIRGRVSQEVSPERFGFIYGLPVKAVRHRCAMQIPLSLTSGLPFSGRHDPREQSNNTLSHSLRFFCYSVYSVISATPHPGKDLRGLLKSQ